MARQRVVDGELPSSIHYHPPLSLLPFPFNYFNFPIITKLHNKKDLKKRKCSSLYYMLANRYYSVFFLL